MTRMFLLLIILSLFLNCSDYRRLNERLEMENTVDATVMLRDAQEKYRRTFGVGQYATFEQLYEKGLIEERFSDGKEYSYEFRLAVSSNCYNLTVVPENKDVNQGEILTLFVNETGIVRASLNPNVIANSDSTPIANQ